MPTKNNNETKVKQKPSVESRQKQKYKKISQHKQPSEQKDHKKRTDFAVSVASHHTIQSFSEPHEKIILQFDNETKQTLFHSVSLLNAINRLHVFVRILRIRSGTP